MKQSFQETKSWIRWFQIFAFFFRIGPSSFGGGYAMIPLIERELKKKRDWIHSDELADMIAVSGSAPGGVGVNAAIYIGYRAGGIMGAISAIAGMTIPTFAIVFGLGIGYSLLSGEPKVQAAFQGIQGAVIGLIAFAAYRMSRSSLFDFTTLILSCGSVLALLFAPIHPLFVLLAGILAGLTVIFIKEKLGLKIQTESKSVQDLQLRFPEYYI